MPGIYEGPGGQKLYGDGREVNPVHSNLANDHAEALKAARTHLQKYDMGFDDCLQLNPDMQAELDDLVSFILVQRQQAVAEDRAKVDPDAMEAAREFLTTPHGGFTRHWIPESLEAMAKALASLLTRYAEQAVAAATPGIERRAKVEVLKGLLPNDADINPYVSEPMRQHWYEDRGVVRRVIEARIRELTSTPAPPSCNPPQ